MEQKALDLLDIFHLKEYAEQPASSLPYGQQRKLEIARALATDMKVLLLDEPAAGMNPTETAELVECISIVRERFGIAILLIEHDMSLVMKLCERITVIDYGQTIAEGGAGGDSQQPARHSRLPGRERRRGGREPCLRFRTCTSLTAPCAP